MVDGHHARTASSSDDGHEFESRVRPLHGRLTLWISLRMGPALLSRMSVDDVLQETLLQAHRSLASFEEVDEDAFRRWIFSIAENRIKDLHRYHTAKKRDLGREARTQDERALLERISTGDPTPSSLMRHKETDDRVAEAILRLPEALREILILHAIELVPLRQIAKQMRTRPETIAARYAQSLAALKNELDGGSRS